MYQITVERSEDGPEVEALYEQSLHLQQEFKATHFLREGNSRITELCFVLRGARILCASIRHWPIIIDGEYPALLLGPLVVGTGWRRRSFGKTLVRHSLGRSKTLGYRAVLVLGDPNYFSYFGFSGELTSKLMLPGVVSMEWLQGYEHSKGYLSSLSGTVIARRNEGNKHRT